ncbi:MAG: aminopeptidase [Thermodesulfobacteriota bacterium]
MLTEKQLDRYADVLLWGLSTSRKKHFQKNDIVVIRYNLQAVRLAEILFEKLLASGRNPIPRSVQTANMEQRFFILSNNDQLIFKAPGEQELIRHLNGSIAIIAPESLTHLSGVDPRKIGKAATARKPLRDILEKRENRGDFSWTLGMFPTAALAGHAGMSQAEYARQIVRACFLDKVSPVSHWQEIFKKAQVIKKWLNSMKMKSIRIESKRMDLLITPGENRKWVGISGHNIPSFEIFLSPDWRGTSGVYFADMPSYRDGNLVKNLRIEFKSGKAVTITAEKGEHFARRLLATDPGAGRLGEFSLTDRRFSKIDRFMANTLFDENFGGSHGNCHVALGSSYADTYTGNPAELTSSRKKKLGFNESAIHWDVINTENKCVTALLDNGRKKIIYENGLFAV